MGFQVRFTEEAQHDLEHLHDGLLQRVEGDYRVAESALQAIRDGIAVLELAPLSCRKASAGEPFVCELVLGFGVSGYVLLFDLEDSQAVTVLALRHQQEADYH